MGLILVSHSRPSIYYYDHRYDEQIIILISIRMFITFIQINVLQSILNGILKQRKDMEVY